MKKTVEQHEAEKHDGTPITIEGLFFTIFAVVALVLIVSGVIFWIHRLNPQSWENHQWHCDAPNEQPLTSFTIGKTDAGTWWTHIGPTSENVMYCENKDGDLGEFFIQN